MNKRKPKAICKFKLTTFCGLFLIGVSCSENSADKEEMEWKGDFVTFEDSFEKKQVMESTEVGSVLYLKGETKPFSGSVERNSTQRLSLDEYEDGLLDGVSLRKSADGSWVEANYKAGKLHGKMTFYDNSGKIRSEMNFENGKLIPQSAELGK